MHSKQNTGSHSAQRRPLKPWIKIAAAVLAVLLLALVGLRLRSWLEQRREARNVVLVNPWNDVDKSGFRPRLTKVEGVEVDTSCAAALERMMEDCRATGCPITLTGGYRSREEQLRIFNNEIDRQIQNGRSSDAAYTIAEQRVGAPGTSEHELGLAVDFQGAAAQEWLRQNAWRYGFILRYQEGCENVTGRSADAAHYRYVGDTVSQQIYELGITLEEYTGMFYTQEAEIVIEK